MVNAAGIPHDLRGLNNWLIWRERLEAGRDRPAKVPCSLLDGKDCDVTDWHNFGQFDIALKCTTYIGVTGIGFVLRALDGIICIDLDNCVEIETGHVAEPAWQIVQRFNSWAEYSHSGKGLHIWIRGMKHPNMKDRPKLIKPMGFGVEIYNDKRYIAVTGSTALNVPIRDCQADFETFYREYFGEWSQVVAGPWQPTVGSQPVTAEDTQILEWMFSAANGQKAKDLYEGNWKIYSEYFDPAKMNEISHNGPDQALMDIIRFYSKNDDQCIKIFMSSALGQRDKSKERIGSYVRDQLLKKAKDHDLPQVTINYKDLTPAPVVDLPTVSLTPLIDAIPADVQIAWPTGLVGEIASFNYFGAAYPMSMAAIMGAIGFMSGICGRAFNINGEGLNTYQLLLGKSSAGKELMVRGAHRLLSSLTQAVIINGIFQTDQKLEGLQKFIGPRKFSSKQGFDRVVGDHLSFVSYINEFGHDLKNIRNSKNSADHSVIEALLDIYPKSGYPTKYGGTARSKKDESLSSVLCPAVSLVGDSTPDVFYELVTQNLLDDGFIPRFDIVDDPTFEIEMNENAWMLKPSEALTANLKELVYICLDRNKNMEINGPIQVVLNDDIKEYVKACLRQIRIMTRDTKTDVWGKLNVRVLRIAAILAVGVWSKTRATQNPIIYYEHFQWALTYCVANAKRLFNKIESGVTGGNLEGQQDAFFTIILKEYANSPLDKMAKSYRINPHEHAMKIVSHSYLHQRLQSKGCFINNPGGKARALARCLQTFTANGYLQEVAARDSAGNSLHGKRWRIVDF